MDDRNNLKGINPNTQTKI